MRAMTGTEVRQAVRGRWLTRNEPIPITGVCIDSRKTQAGDLFVAISGEHFDGHDYLLQAADAGAVAAVVVQKHPLPDGALERFPAGVVGVEDTRAALLELGAFYRSTLPATVVAVTGSNGKTTVKRMIDHILRSRLKGICSPRSFNNEIGVPMTLFSAGLGDDYIVCEVGSNAPGEISSLSRAVRPDLGVITSVGPVHLEKLGSIARVAVEKASVLAWLNDRGMAVVTADSPELNHALQSYDLRMIRFGADASAQLRLTGYESTAEGWRFQINERDWYSLAIPGRHNALNAMAAIAVAARFGIPQDAAGEALADFLGVPMRLEPINVNGMTLINDAYNANPASMKAAADVLVDMDGQRKVFIAGDMLELGDMSSQLHREVGQYLAEQGLDLVCGVGPLGSQIAHAAKMGGTEAEQFESTEQAVSKLPTLLKEGDTVLIKASRGMALENVVEAITRSCQAEDAE